MTELFAAVLTRTNEDRKVVMSGIERFNKRQHERAKDIEKEGLSLPPDTERPPQGKKYRRAKSASFPMPKTKYKWEVRVFQEKQANIPLACEIPELIDQRAGDVARAIRAQMKS